MLGSGLALVRATSRRTPRSLLVPSGDALRLCPMYSTDSDAPTTTGNVFVYTSPYGPTVRRVKVGTSKIKLIAWTDSVP